jgi:hypothetical protein
MATIAYHRNHHVSGKLFGGIHLAVFIKHGNAQLPGRHYRWTDSAARLGATQADKTENGKVTIISTTKILKLPRMCLGCTGWTPSE